ncbi:MAG: hypothetical protein Q8M24_11360 [Pseudolabrys sp.]|nr:hypothetical protein [Pseudolabrys sp.]
MFSFPWKRALAAAAILAGSVYGVAAQSPSASGPMGMHEKMMQGAGGMHGSQGHSGPGPHGASPGQPSGAAETPTMPGQDAFGTIQEVVQMLEADPATDWSKVNIGALREHLIDMHEVTLRARAVERMLDNGIEITVTGEGRTRDAIKRMVPAHMRELANSGWTTKTEDLADGVKVTVTTADGSQLARLKGLGFMGLMVQGGHHQPHHLMMANGQFPMH